MMITCCVCNKPLKQITRNHLHRHGLSVADYRVRFPDAPLQDESIIMRGLRNPFFGKHHTVELKKWQHDRFHGRPNPKTAHKKVLWWKSEEGEKRRAQMQSEEYKRIQREALIQWWSTASPEEIIPRFERRRVTNVTTGQWLSLDDKEPFEAYSYDVRTRTEQVFRENFYLIENAHLRGKGYELDHIVSIYDGFRNQVPAELIASIKNLRMLTLHENRVKGRNSHQSLKALL